MSLPVFQATIVNEFGEIIPSPVMTILDESTGQPASLFSDRNGAFPLGTNGVFTGGTNGFAQFFTAAGNYRVKAEQASAGFEQTWDFVAMVGDAAFYQVGTGASQIPTNALLPNFGTAAEADVQTSPTDTTAGALLNNETTHIGGEINFTGVNYQPETVDGIGVVRKLKNISGVSIANGATVSGSSISNYYVTDTGALLSSASPAGTWQNISGVNIGINLGHDFVRIA